MEIRLIKKDTYAIIKESDCILVTDKKGLREIYNRMVKSKTMKKQEFLAKNFFNMYTYYGNCTNSLNLALNYILSVDTDEEYNDEENRCEIIDKLDFYGDANVLVYTEHNFVQVLLECRYDNTEFNYIDITHDFINNEIYPIIAPKVKQ